MEYFFHPIGIEDREAIMDIFNYYIEHSFAAYPETRLPYEAFEMFLHMARGFPSATVTDQERRIIGFGMLRAYSPIPAFSRTAEVTYFIHPDHTGKGIGQALLDFFKEAGKEKDITSILASISSLNPGSIKFHERNGFTECGRFKAIGKKHGQVFDTIWMQKIL